MLLLPSNICCTGISLRRLIMALDLRLALAVQPQLHLGFGMVQLGETSKPQLQQVSGGTLLFRMKARAARQECF
jgi:hypothetical protein